MTAPDAARAWSRSEALFFARRTSGTYRLVCEAFFLLRYVSRKNKNNAFSHLPQKRTYETHLRQNPMTTNSSISAEAAVNKTQVSRRKAVHWHAWTPSFIALVFPCKDILRNTAHSCTTSVAAGAQQPAARSEHVEKQLHEAHHADWVLLLMMPVGCVTCWRTD